MSNPWIIEYSYFDMKKDIGNLRFVRNFIFTYTII